MGNRAVVLIAGLLLATSAAPTPVARADSPDAAAAAEAQKAAATLVERMTSSDVEVRKTAMADALKVQHPLVTAALSKALSDADETVRTAALKALVARTDDVGKKAAVAAIVARLERIVKTPESAGERLKLITALHDMAQPSALQALAAETGPDVAPEELAARLRAIANLPCREAIEEIIHYMTRAGRPGDGLDWRRRMGRDAIKYAVGVDAGRDSDEMRKWWKEHEKGFDYRAAAARRAHDGGGPKAEPSDGKPPAK